MEFSKKNNKEEKVTFKPRIDTIEDEEQLKYGENEEENLSNHRNEYNELMELKNEVQHHDELQELMEDENEILEQILWR